MEINKRLILNRTPKDMPYGSICSAKNMMTDDTGSFLTNDIGFKESFNVHHEWVEGDDVYLYREIIVGVIPCNNELIIFTYNPDKYTSHIYRKPDNVSINYFNRETYIVNTVWNWSGGKLCGTYTYNYKGELIIAVGEYDCPGDVKIPLKSWNLDSNSEFQTYNIEENIPVYNSSYSVKTNGSLVCGVYTFFIRFKIDEFNYTKWFQITGDINITQEAQSKKYSHQYLYRGDLADYIELESFTVNSNNISNKGIVVKITILGDNFSNFQLGYIIKRNDDISGRIQGEYYITQQEQNIPVVNNNHIEEISVDKFLENPHQFFNVKNIINYNNRLYISNYEEYPIIDLGDFAKNNTRISISGEQPNRRNDEPLRDENTSKIWNITFSIYQMRSYRPYDILNTGVSISDVQADENGYVSSTDKNKIISLISRYLKLLIIEGAPIGWNDEGIATNLYLFIQSATIYNNSGTACLVKKINSSDREYPPNLGWNFVIPDYRIKITGTTALDLDLIIEYEENGVTKEYSLLRKNGEHLSIIGYLNSDLIYFGNGHSYTDFNPTIKEGNQIQDDIRISIETAYYRNDDDPEEDDDDPSESGGEVKQAGINVRTLYPYQKYNFFIHYIRKDGSFTLGFPISDEFKHYKLSDDNTVIIPKVSASKPGEDYIGYFITYEDVESTVDCVRITHAEGEAGEDKSIEFTNSKYLFDLDNIRGNKLYIDGTEYNIQGEIKYIENRLTFNHLKAVLDDTETETIEGGKTAYFVKVINNIYRNKSKVLYRLTRNIYYWDVDIKEYDYLPAFYSAQLMLLYVKSSQNDSAKEVIIDPANSFVMGLNFDEVTQDGRTTYQAKWISIPMYSDVPTEAMSIKEDFQQAAATLTYQDSQDNSVTKLRINSLVSPDKLHDLLELKSAYRAKPSKSYTNFNINNIYKFDKTIYRSDVISDESLENNFRNFEIDNYKNILENKGKIINIVGIGLYFIVHTEQSIFVFDRTPKLTSRSQLDIPDVFDIDYQDITPSNEGFGGLTEKEEAILTKNGYIWFDKTNKMLLNFENGKIDILSSDINNFLKNIDVRYIRFAEDIIYNRLIICIYIGELNKATTLSYNFNTKSFISAHDYKFTHNFRTSNKSYVFNTVSAEKLYEFDKNSKVDYKGLYDDCLGFYDYGIGKSYIDIIFNKDYFTVKSLRSIRYCLSTIGEYIGPKPPEEELDRKFSGDNIRVYSDETDSGDLDIKVDKNKINDLDKYNLPYYEKGYWNFNNFRNGLNIEGHSKNADDLSLIYGKYIVVRFIFNNDNNIKFDGVEANFDKY